MSSDDSSIISLEEVNKSLEDIENKYSPIKKIDVKNGMEEELVVLSKELDTVGLPVINISNPIDLILKEVITSCRTLVHQHRRNLLKITDAELDNQSKNRRIATLYKSIDEYKLELNKNENRSYKIENKLLIAQNENSELIKKEHMLKEEMDKLKRYHSSKQNETIRQYKNLMSDYQNIKKIYDRDVSCSKNDIFMQMLGKYRENEEIYKITIQKLQENNQNLMEQILELKGADISNTFTKSNP